MSALEGSGLADFATPAGAPPAHVERETAGEIAFARGRWDAASLAALTRHLAGRGAEALAALDDEALLAAWSATVERFLDARSPERHALEPALRTSTGLSREGLAAGLEAVLGGVRERHARELAARARARPREARGSRRLALVVLAGNLPALAVQPLLPALLLRRPLLLKSSSDEPLFAPAFVAALARTLPPIGDAAAAVCWPGGDAGLESPVLDLVDPVLAYGDRAAIDDLRRRAKGRVVDYGPKLSFALVGGDAHLEPAARGIARDIALFDQRGCLSVQAVFVAGGAARADAFAQMLAGALEELARTLPPGTINEALAARVQQLRGEAAMRGALVGKLSLAVGTVISEPAGGGLAASPGLRTVHVHPVAGIEETLARLAGWEPLLQGAALAGADAWTLAPELARLGVSRCAEAGELQSADAAWHNGGRDPLDVLS